MIVVSGGQTGVDRAALDAAMALGIPVGGWCPRGRLSEDGEIPARYPLRETPESNYSVRTVANIRDSDYTLILLPGDAPLTGGTALTVRIARQMKRPHSVFRLDSSPAIAAMMLKSVPRLNVAGPRESKHPGIYQQAYDWMLRLLD